MQLRRRNILIVLGITLLMWFLSPLSLSAKKNGQKSSDVSSQVDDKTNFKFEYFYAEAVRAKLAGDLASASDLLFRCHWLNPNAGIVYFELATISSMQQQYQSAVVYAKRAVNLNPTSVRYQRALAELLGRANQYEAAIDAYNDLVKIDAKHAKNYYPQLATLYSLTKQYDKACGAWDKYADIVGLSADIVEEKFKLYVQADDKKMAIKQIDELIEKYPDELNYVAFKAEMYCVLGDTLSGDLVFKKAFSKDADNPMLQYLFAKYSTDVHQPERAKEYYVAAIENEKSTFDIRSVSIVAATLDSSIYEQDTIYQKFINDYPSEFIPYYCYGLALIYRNDTLSLDYFKKSLSINPNQEELWDQLMTTYAELTRVDSVIAVGEQAVQYCPENVRFRYTLGNAYAVKDKWAYNEKALHQWTVGLEYSKKKNDELMTSALYGLIGDMNHRMGKVAEAYAAYDSALVYNPENTSVMNNYAYFLCLENGDLDRAERMSVKTVKANPKSPVFLDTYAWICFKQGSYSMAALYIEQAYNNGGDVDPELTEHYGDILFKVGEPKSSYLPYWQKALEMRNGKTDESFDAKKLELLKKKVKEETYVE